MVNLLTNLTAAASAATLIGIFDFQKHNLIQFIYCDDLSPVSKLSRGSTSAPAIWTLVGGPLTFQIAGNCVVNNFLTYPSGLSADARHSPLVTRPGATTSWSIQLVNPTIPTRPWFILDNISREAITAWNGDPASVNGRAPCCTDHPLRFEYHGHPPAVLVLRNQRRRCKAIAVLWAACRLIARGLISACSPNIRRPQQNQQNVVLLENTGILSYNNVQCGVLENDLDTCFNPAHLSVIRKKPRRRRCTWRDMFYWNAGPQAREEQSLSQ
ncbi:hypothetical protein C8J57DRAFT_1213286 [Mycena rebaudengoi]|nr:hypothetical protein C8J57DRAFT_1213286 [Mycena rebaudengoi]